MYKVNKNVVIGMLVFGAIVILIIAMSGDPNYKAGPGGTLFILLMSLIPAYLVWKNKL